MAGDTEMKIAIALVADPQEPAPFEAGIPEEEDRCGRQRASPRDLSRETG
jgi:hypothetical protein